MTAVLLFALLLGIVALPAEAQPQCTDLLGGELMAVPEISRDPAKERVRGTLVTAGENQLIAFIKTRESGTITAANLNCAKQWVRTFRKDAPATSQGTDAPTTLPQPGPTIRTRVGDLVQLTFLNLIDPLNFARADTGKCDEFQDNTGQRYPRTDTYPNCFHGSVFTNIHFHGTHTSPNTTADNVFLQIVPAPRSKDRARTPAVTAESVKDDFAKFFAKCESHLDLNDAPQLWPVIWSDFPRTYRATQDKLLLAHRKSLYDDNKKALANGGFPQNYIGAFPYCFRLPVFNQAAAHAAHHGAPPKVKMGQAPGTHWYHAHKHGSTTINVSNGMTGVMIIEGLYDDEIRDAYKATGIKEQVLVVNQIGDRPALEGGSQGGPGPYFWVNGRLQPTITMKPGEVQLWRIANTSSRSTMVFEAPPAAGTRVTWRQLAKDGVQLTNANYLASENQEVLLASGNRADLLVKAPNEVSVTIPITVINTINASRSRTSKQLLLNVKTGTTAQDMPFMDRSQTQFPPFLNDIAESEVDRRRTMTFSTEANATSGFNDHKIDGKQFTGEVGALVLLDETEEWTVVNESFGRTAIAHPFHIHVNPFQIVEVFDPHEKLDDGTTPRYTTNPSQAGQCRIDVNDKSTWKPCAEVPKPSNAWHDVFSIPAGNTFNGVRVPGYFKMRSRFVDYPGYYVLHCHILAHEDRGMMTVVSIAPLQPPFSHH